MTDVTGMLERLAAGPKPFACVITYADGRVERIAQPRRIQAERIADCQRRKIGRDLISRATGQTVRIVSVAVEGAE